MTDLVETVSGIRMFVDLPTTSPIIEIWEDGGDLMAETAIGEIYRIDRERRVIRAN